MILTIPGTSIEIDTATRRDGSRWVDVYDDNKKIGTFDSINDVCDFLQEVFGVDDEGMNQLQNRRL
jgi:hypothetical protein